MQGTTQDDFGIGGAMSLIDISPDHVSQEVRYLPSTDYSTIMADAQRLSHLDLAISLSVLTKL